MLTLILRSFPSILLLSCTFLVRPNLALHVTPGSNCLATCSQASSNTLEADVVCTDAEYSSTANGTRFQSCVQCELGSTAVDAQTGETDVGWGVYNLRYALSTCVFGFPTSKSSLSSPCQVSCTPLSSAIELKLNNTPAIDDFNFCNNPAFSAAAVNKCASCYALTSGQQYLSNFFQTLLDVCQTKPGAGGLIGGLSATSIFSSSPLPSTTPTPTAQPSSKQSTNLAVVIAVPIIAFLILSAISVGCFFCVRGRRKRQRDSWNRRHLHARWGDTTISTPIPPVDGRWDWNKLASADSSRTGNPWHDSTVNGPGERSYLPGYGSRQEEDNGIDIATSPDEGAPPSFPPEKPVEARSNPALKANLILPWAAGRGNWPVQQPPPQDDYPLQPIPSEYKDPNMAPRYINTRSSPIDPYRKGNEKQSPVQKPAGSVGNYYNSLALSPYPKTVPLKFPNQFDEDQSPNLISFSPESARPERGLYKTATTMTGDRSEISTSMSPTPASKPGSFDERA